MKPLVNSYIQKLVQTKWDVAVHGRDLYLVKPTLGPPKKFQHLTRAEEVVITRLRIGHTKATNSTSCPEDRQLVVTIVVKHWHIYLCRTANMSWRMCVVVKQIQSNQQFPAAPAITEPPPRLSAVNVEIYFHI